MYRRGSRRESEDDENYPNKIYMIAITVCTYIYIKENILKTLGLQKSRVQKYFFVQDEDYSGFIPSFCRRLTVRITIIIIPVSNTYACT